MYPWHSTKDPYQIFVAEFFLRRTTRKVVERIFPAVIAAYPDPVALSEADAEELYDIARPAGLKGRTVGLIRTAQEIVRAGGLTPDRGALMRLPSVGPYIADAVLLYAFDQRTFPLDSSVQRVIHRSVAGRHPDYAVRPYTDRALAAAVGLVVSGPDSASSTRRLHQGVLSVAWLSCRANPKCSLCELSEGCQFRRKSDGEADSATP